MKVISKIRLTGLQVKSFEKAEKLAYALNIIEEECGIHNVEITFKDFFVCPWIDFKELDKTEMEILVRDLLTRKIK
jgi:hypothetical protein